MAPPHVPSESAQDGTDAQPRRFARRPGKQVLTPRLQALARAKRQQEFLAQLEADGYFHNPSSSTGQVAPTEQLKVCTPATETSHSTGDQIEGALPSISTLSIDKTRTKRPRRALTPVYSPDSTLKSLLKTGFEGSITRNRSKAIMKIIEENSAQDGNLESVDAAPINTSDIDTEMHITSTDHPNTLTDAAANQEVVLDAEFGPTQTESSNMSTDHMETQTKPIENETSSEKPPSTKKVTFAIEADISQATRHNASVEQLKAHASLANSDFSSTQHNYTGQVVSENELTQNQAGFENNHSNSIQHQSTGQVVSENGLTQNQAVSGHKSASGNAAQAIPIQGQTFPMSTTSTVPFTPHNTSTTIKRPILDNPAYGTGTLAGVPYGIIPTYLGSAHHRRAASQNEAKPTVVVVDDEQHCFRRVSVDHPLAIAQDEEFKSNKKLVDDPMDPKTFAMFTTVSRTAHTRGERAAVQLQKNMNKDFGRGKAPPGHRDAYAMKVVQAGTERESARGQYASVGTLKAQSYEEERQPQQVLVAEPAHENVLSEQRREFDEELKQQQRMYREAMEEQQRKHDQALREQQRKHKEVLGEHERKQSEMSQELSKYRLAELKEQIAEKKREASRKYRAKKKQQTIDNAAAAAATVTAAAPTTANANADLAINTNAQQASAPNTMALRQSMTTSQPVVAPQIVAAAQASALPQTVIASQTTSAPPAPSASTQPITAVSGDGNIDMVSVPGKRTASVDDQLPVAKKVRGPNQQAASKIARLAAEAYTLLVEQDNARHGIQPSEHTAGGTLLEPPEPTGRVIDTAADVEAYYQRCLEQARLNGINTTMTNEPNSNPGNSNPNGDIETINRRREAARERVLKRREDESYWLHRWIGQDDIENPRATMESRMNRTRDGADDGDSGWDYYCAGLPDDDQEQEEEQYEHQWENERLEELRRMR